MVEFENLAKWTLLYVRLFSLVQCKYKHDRFDLYWQVGRAVYENLSKNCCEFLSQSDCPYSEKVPSIKIPMDIMEQQPFLSESKPSDSE